MSLRKIFEYTTAVREALSLSDGDAGLLVYDTTLRAYFTWDGSAWDSFGGSGDMVLASVQTVTGAKTFNAGKLKVNNAGNTFATILASAATAARTLTLPDATDTVVTLAEAQTLTNKTLTAPVLGGTITGTYTIGGTPTLGASVTLVDDTVSIGDATHRLTTLAAKNISGGSLLTLKSTSEIDVEINGSTIIEFVAASMRPGGDLTRDLGATSRRWANVYAGVTFANNMTIAPAVAPSAPATGRWTLYVDSGDGNKLKAIAGNGTIALLGTP